MPTRPEMKRAMPHFLDQQALARGRKVGISGAACCVIDCILPLLMVAAAFLLGAQELFDADVWWHLRSGQLILRERLVPSLDPFTFTSADRSWINLHWLFQVMLAVAFAAGGVRGIVVATAVVCAGAIVAVLILRDLRWPTWLVTLCWLPALALMSARFVPRPEIFSVLWMALYLTILLKVDVKPGLAWFLPLIQVLWVNTHGLFVFGPMILAAYLAERLTAPVREYGGAGNGPPSARQALVGPRGRCHGHGGNRVPGEPLRSARCSLPAGTVPEDHCLGRTL